MTTCSVSIGEFSTKHLYRLYGLSKAEELQEEDMKESLGLFINNIHMILIVLDPPTFRVSLEHFGGLFKI